MVSSPYFYPARPPRSSVWTVPSLHGPPHNNPVRQARLRDGDWPAVTQGALWLSGGLSLDLPGYAPLPADLQLLQTIACLLRPLVEGAQPHTHCPGILEHRGQAGGCLVQELPGKGSPHPCLPAAIAEAALASSPPLAGLGEGASSRLPLPPGPCCAPPPESQADAQALGGGKMVCSPEGSAHGSEACARSSPGTATAATRRGEQQKDTKGGGATGEPKEATTPPPAEVQGHPQGRAQLIGPSW